MKIKIFKIVFWSVFTLIIVSAILFGIVFSIINEYRYSFKKLGITDSETYHVYVESMGDRFEITDMVVRKNRFVLSNGKNYKIDIYSGNTLVKTDCIEAVNVSFYDLIKGLTFMESVWILIGITLLIIIYSVCIDIISKNNKEK